MKKYEIKIQLIKELKNILQTKLLMYKKSMEEAQEEANSHIGAMQSRYDTFKEEAQMLKDGYARQYNNVQEILEKVDKFEYYFTKNPQEDNMVKYGSVVSVIISNLESNFFIFSTLSLETIKIDDTEYKIINYDTPLAQALRGKDVDDEIDFNGELIEIVDVF